MDIRGIEVTNQLRSAIRAKLLELGVRYDEELPDYILVMVVNKKSRQQMHEDLNLFLEDSTTPFVDWLHDQVLKKLQKVTVAKKKSSREFVPTVVVKQEEERKKRKTSTTSFLEDHTTEQSGEKPTVKNIKDDKSLHKPVAKMTLLNQSNYANHVKGTDKCPKLAHNENKSSNISTPINNQIQESIVTKDNTSLEVTKSGAEVNKNSKTPNTSTRILKRPLESGNEHHESLEKKDNSGKLSKSLEENDNTPEDNVKKLKSFVVSVKNRLGVASPRKKFEIYREKADNEARHKQLEKRFDKKRFNSSHNTNSQRNRNFELEERAKRNREIETRQQEADRANDIKSRLGTIRNDRSNKLIDIKDKDNPNFKSKILSDKLTGSIKDRLGISNAHRLQQKLTLDTVEYKTNKCLEQDRNTLTSNKNIKTRLGPLKNNFKPMNSKNYLNPLIQSSNVSKDENPPEVIIEEELNDEVDEEINAGPLKSHIIAVKKSIPPKTEKKRIKAIEKVNKKISNNVDEEEIEESKLPSKVIVTPRPLKPLQPLQKRATQSLLLRAVAEANQSVVKQKNPEPCLMEKKPVLKRLRPAAPSRELSQSLSVRFNANKRLVMEKIQVELNTADSVESEPKPYMPHVTDEHMGVVMSLFQRNDNNQKFLVTLNGYNNNHTKEKTISDDEERLEMEVTEDDEMALLTVQNDTLVPSDSDPNILRITDLDDDADSIIKDINEENNENCNIENVDVVENIQTKRRKLSPIIYNRSHSPSPVEVKSTMVYGSSVTTTKRKKPNVESSVSTVIDKSKEKCRYWPNCTLGNKCAFMHPTVMCSAFPACKFGDKCAYKHPKCKFGLSCTKLGCVFSHPTQQCKYHPFCNKPACPYSHPVTHTVLIPEANTQRAKFTWRRSD
ncbi:zinc finger CCCH domain-containing protein 14 [Polistes fuscatus]|uniref:zinc finger CCCH domain-containing protein 14 n=1 Tax=Polistes fuscatus TaxID=30207 RepID=UPI001CA8398F|nr:zinc finger CCCH domain-containing protein 14 [Polistes fuscatus]XP_043485499.1 zinc finger CCCH domain-containing protein 14 [Polistes fuscatus]